MGAWDGLQQGFEGAEAGEARRRSSWDVWFALQLLFAV
jgi:hypothetical protein